jgi:multisubunit Na+/H+ antiporter MnhC subunit
MIPAWIWAAVITVIGGIVALWIGSTLPDYDPFYAFFLIAMVVCCVLCAASNNFPLLLALGSWIPFFPHIGPFSSMPITTYFVGWMVGVLFFRLCLKGYLPYRRSYNWFLLLIFAWVPIRFLMNPVYKLGGTAGGSGVSGALPYFNYCLAGAMLVVVGAILTDRQKIISFLRWCFVVVLLVGIVFTICAFIPATAPYLVYMGSFNAGNISDGIQRLVQLPGYGLFLVEVALCPALFRLRGWTPAFVFVAGFFMIVVGGNRSAVAAAIIVIPVILLLRRQSHAVLLSLALTVAAIGLLRVTISNMDEQNIPGLVRSFGVFDEKIDEASGGKASAEWRYEVWRDGIAKIEEAPLVGKGFGNLPQHLENSDVERSTDFETVLAGGESHNGFINAAYGFGIPFTLALSVMIVWFLIKESAKALATDKHDPEFQQLHAFLAGMFATYPILIYTAFDMSVGLLWTYVSISCLISHLPPSDVQAIADPGASMRKYGEEARPVGAYAYRPR